MLDILARFKEKYKHLEKKGLIIEGMVVIDHAKRQTALEVSRPFLFDNRALPKKFDGLTIKKKIHGEMPEEFKIDRTQPDWHKREYIWAPERFECYVDRCFAEIAVKLGVEQPTREDLLDALCFGDFEEHCLKTEALIRQGKVPAFHPLRPRELAHA
jgi:hypothetical protein